MNRVSGAKQGSVMEIDWTNLQEATDEQLVAGFQRVSDSMLENPPWRTLSIG
jgi:hypothetical protein